MPSKKDRNLSRLLVFNKPDTYSDQKKEKPTQVWKGLKDLKQEQQKCKTPWARFKILQNRQSSFFLVKFENI